MIFIIKVTTNKEERAVDMISERIEKKELNVFSVSRPGCKNFPPKKCPGYCVSTANRVPCPAGGHGRI